VKHSIATILGQKGDYEAALELFRANINNRPKKLDSWLGIALIYLSQNQTQKALDFLNKLQVQNPLEPIIYELLLECAIDRKEQREIELNREIILLLRSL
jgi:predicted Zn-dependent protease